MSNYKNQLKDIPRCIIKRLLIEQEKVSNPKNELVFDRDIWAGIDKGGFSWALSEDGDSFWSKVLIEQDFNVFYEVYGKENSVYKVKIK